jgi:hypothetical protein
VLALIELSVHGHGAIVLVSDDTPAAMLTRYLPALMVECIAVAVVRWRPEHRHPVVVLDPTQLAVVRDIAPDQITPLSAPRRSLVVHPSREEPMDPRVVHPKSGEVRVDGDDVRVRVRHRARAGSEITRRVGDDARWHAPRGVRSDW